MSLNMDQQRISGKSHWALIIGIDHYSDPRENLRGSVNDASVMKEYLELSIGADLNVAILTATIPEILPGSPPEEQHSRPTFDNIVAHLGRIANEAKPGDRVVIYFAGHGTYIPKGSTHALTILAESGTAKKYFRLDALYRRVELLVAKRLAVTLILDCCFSGAIVRGDNEVETRVRCLDFDSTVAMTPEPLLLESEDCLMTRDAVMGFDWFKYDTSLVVLCGCAPHERTFETLLNGKTQGVFTHHLLHALGTLNNNGITVTHVAVHEQLSTSLHADWPRQTPMRYGKANGVLFGDSLLAPEKTSISVSMRKSGELCLRAGEVHGIVVGDEFYAALANTPSATQRIANVRATVVRAVESDLEVIEGRFIAAREVNSRGWEAEILSSLSLRVLLVGMPPGVVNIQSISQETFRYLRLVHTPQDTQSHSGDICMYNVVVNSKDQYEVVDAVMERVSPIPAIDRNSNDTPHQIVRILQHMADFKYFESLENRVPCPRLQASLRVTCNPPRGSSNKIDVMRDENVVFSFTNTGDEQLYIYAFDLSPSWQVTAFFGQGFRMLPARQGNTMGARDVVVTMRWPKHLSADLNQYCEDNIKFLITNEAAHFHWSLSDIFTTIKGSDDSHRGDSKGLYADLASFFGGFREDRRGKWTTQSFFVRTCSGKSPYDS